MTRPDWPVTEKVGRGIETTGVCLYCKRALGDQHKEDCVIRRRTVVVRMIAEYVVTVPEDWDVDQILFQRNEGSWCASNGLREVVEMLQKNDIVVESKTTEPYEEGSKIIDPCDFVRYEFIREATEQDETNFSIFVKEVES